MVIVNLITLIVVVIFPKWYEFTRHLAVIRLLFLCIRNACFVCTKFLLRKLFKTMNKEGAINFVSKIELYIIIFFSCCSYVKHKACMNVHQLDLSWARSLNFFHDFPLRFVSFLISLRYVSLGVPQLPLPCGFQSRATLLMAVGLCLIVWPIHFNLRCFIIDSIGLWCILSHDVCC